LGVFAAELAIASSRMSQTFDEACHIFAGYRYWKNFDFGINPEHPPLVKLMAAMPLLSLHLRAPALPQGYFKGVEFIGGRQFLYANDANTLLLRARLAAALLALALALTVFLAARSMWGKGPAFLALVLLVFEPNIVAHGSLVTTDMGVTFGIFLAVFCFYSFVKRSSVPWLIATGVAAGIALATKHSGILIFPILLLLGFLEWLLHCGTRREDSPKDNSRKALTLAASLVAIAAIAVVVLWSTYGFRFAARPAGLHMVPPLAVFAGGADSAGSPLLRGVAHWKLLPESYLYGVADLLHVEGVPNPTYLLGRYYPRAQWFWFPAVFAIKSTLGFLALCCLLAFSPLLRQPDRRRELIFLSIPAAVYFAAAIGSGINLGVRHILPVYPFLIVLVAAGAWSLARTRRGLAVLVAACVVLHVASSLRAFPDDIAFANELWGGPANSYRLVTDSNVDWGQGLKAMKTYLDHHGIKECWFAYFAANVADSSYYGIPCEPLPNSFSVANRIPVPAIPSTIDGPIFLSASEVTGTFWGGDAYNPYLEFRGKRPSALIAHSILCFEGRFDVPAAAAKAHEVAAAQLSETPRLEQAMAEAETALALAPNSAGPHLVRALVLARMQRRAEAEEEYRKAQTLAAAATARH
jgi:Dolichyl-phosphate-mannose-protein mannosyltransferase